ncbi:MAG: SDR family oxidoreductase [Hyphomicrobiales bacterium]
MDKILLTGATGYIGKRLIPVLVDLGYDVTCCVRDINRFSISEYYRDKITLVELDFLNEAKVMNLPKDFDYAYFLIHSMSQKVGGFQMMEEQIANNFAKWADTSNLKQVVYLSGLINTQVFSEHLKARFAVEKILSSSSIPLTVLRAGIVVGSGSASFEIIRDLVEKLPVMVTPKWVNTLSQPIAVRNVIDFLTGVLGKEDAYYKSFDIGGPDIISYKQMMLTLAEVRGLKRSILTLPIMTPRLSSYWLYFVTSTSYPLAVNLVDSMKIELRCKNDDISKICQPELISYKKAIELAFEKVEENHVISSWKDAAIVSGADPHIMDHIQKPNHGCYSDIQYIQIDDPHHVTKNIWNIGGHRGWYYANGLWKIRGIIDKMIGGVGLRRGRTNESIINNGDALDFWRVIVADKNKFRLLLYAEMKLPGEAWLEFSLHKKDDKLFLKQEAVFRPLGLMGRIYWFLMLPFHIFIFKNMAKNIVNFREELP